MFKCKLFQYIVQILWRKKYQTSIFFDFLMNNIVNSHKKLFYTFYSTATFREKIHFFFRLQNIQYNIMSEPISDLKLIEFENFLIKNISLKLSLNQKILTKEANWFKRGFKEMLLIRNNPNTFNSRSDIGSFSIVYSNLIREMKLIIFLERTQTTAYVIG